MEDIEHMGDAEHLLHRPDMYCGSKEPNIHEGHVFNNNKVEHKQLVYPDALLNIALEIITNALDRQWRDPTMTSIKIYMDNEDAGGQGWIRVVNDGQGVPVLFDDANQQWKPYMAFGMFRTGSNFNDAAEGPRYTGGRNGIGCKATNVFSETFKVDTADPTNKKRFQQIFHNNMSSFDEPTIRPYKKKKGYTDIAFLPDYQQFNMDHMTDDVKATLEAAVIDAAATTKKKIKVLLNNEQVQVKSLAHYATLFQSTPNIKAIAQDQVKQDDITQFNVAVFYDTQSVVKQGYGFVNSLRCYEGTHMKLAITKTIDALVKHIKTQYKRPDLKVSKAFIQQHLFFVVHAMVDSPEFSTQTKEKLTTPKARLGFDWTPSKSFLRTLINSGIAEATYQHALQKENKAAASTTSTVSRFSRDVVVDKYVGAVNLRKKHSNCVLLVTEGDSAKQLAMAGLKAIGRENFGVFPLKGKLLNVRTASLAKIMANAEVVNLMKILNLEYGKTYDTLDKVRYKKLVIFTDQDPDGSHIAALLLNFLHHLFPSILMLDPEFVQRFATPLVRVTPKARTKDQEHTFYAIQPYEQWIADEDIDLTKYTIKYYKGLGTSNNTLARQYFEHYDEHVISLTYSSESDPMMEKFFASTEAKTNGPAARRALLTDNYDKDDYVDYEQSHTTYEDFLTKEVLPFAAYANERAIASVIDGLKPSQRKVLFTFLKKNIRHEVKVAQVANVVASETAYHHGEVSLVETTVGMAQDHTGTNNINLLHPEGQFGSRNDPSSEHSAARYIFTHLDPIARFIFRTEDDPILNYLEDEGNSIEPSTFVPVIPMVLVNGCNGIGYGWSSTVQKYNPRDVLQLSRLFLDGMDTQAIQPWAFGHVGQVERVDDVYKSHGQYHVEGSTITITELPIGTWTNPYMAFLEDKLLIRDRKDKPKYKYQPFIEHIDKLSDDTSVHIVLHCNTAALEPYRNQLDKVLKLTDTLRVNNMHLFSEDGQLLHYRDVQSIVHAHGTYRLDMYRQRLAFQLKTCNEELVKLGNKRRFLQAIIDQVITLQHLEEDEAIEQLESLEFLYIDDLLKIPMVAVTQSRLKKLDMMIAQQETLKESIEQSNPSEVWRCELDDFEQALNTYEGQKTQRYTSEQKTPQGKRKRSKAGKRPKKRKRSKAGKRAKKTQDVNL